ncbi:MAG: DUF1579 domain-containing protein [Candidatus Eisenbacteria bacterium]|nr:DUF1579 domain-containing protein [Candidatus Eisenbacteria bacterium]
MNPRPSSCRHRAALALSVCLLAALPAAAWARDAVKAKPAAKAAAKPEASAPAAPDSMMAEMMKLATPGPAHATLKAMEGKWKAVVKSWNGPGEPSVSEGTAENRMILGGRYLEERFQSTMMQMPFEGYGLTGYDNASHRYQSLWVDNMSTSMMTSAGAMDDAGKTLTMTATAPGPDGKPMDMRMVNKIVDENTHVFSMYGIMGGQEQLMMEITYTRM